MFLIDSLAHRSRLRRTSVAAKAGFSFTCMLFCLISGSRLAAGYVFLVCTVLTTAAGGIPFRLYRRLLIPPVLFLAAGIAVTGVEVSAIPKGLFAVRIADMYLTADRAGVVRSLYPAITAMACVSAFYFLIVNTETADLMDGLARMHMPKVLVVLMFLTYRFIFILNETAAGLMTARKARLGTGTVRRAFYSFGQLGGSLFFMALKRSNRMYEALEARCYDGNIPVLNERQRIPLKQLAGMVIFVCSLCLMVYIEQILF